MAATMGIDIGLCETSLLDEAPPKENPFSSSFSSSTNAGTPAKNTIERCRTILACYLLCSGYARTFMMSLHSVLANVHKVSQ